MDKKSILNQVLTWGVSIVLIAALFLLAPCLGLYYLWCGLSDILSAVYSKTISVWAILAVLFSFGKGAILFAIEWKLLTSILVKYEFSTKGIMLNYWGRCSQIIAWEALQEVCVCYADYNARPDRTLTKVICFIQKGEKKNIYGRWKVDNFLRFPKIIRIDYSSTLYDEISSVCPYDIVEYDYPRWSHFG